jgi:hypothetical protein
MMMKKKRCYISIVKVKRKRRSPGVDVRYVSENFSMEILKNKLKEHLPLNFIPMTFEEVLAQKR